jgi:hypothetical protein
VTAALRVLGLLLVALCLGTGASVARADAATPPAAVDDGQHGLVVLGVGSSVDVAWPLARAVYADSALRPPTLDEPHARVLVGEPPGDAAPAELRDLAETRAAVHGDDAASRHLLESIALSLHVRGVVVVQPTSTPFERPVARVFVTVLRSFDAVVYESDPPVPVTWGNGAGAVTWAGASQALRRGFADTPIVAVAPVVPPSPTVASAVALHPVPAGAAHPADSGASGKQAFYQSPWFWAAAGAALFAAGAVYFATRNDSSDNIQLQLQVPR